MKQLSLDEFTSLTASKEPVPGGGGVSALTASLAASLAEMVTSLTTGKKAYAQYQTEIEDIMKETELLRGLLLDCIDKDAEAFKPLADVYRMDKTAEGYEEKLEECLKEAAKPPYLILKYCCRIIELDERLAVIGSKLAVSDAGTSVMLAHGALHGAALNVYVNTRLMKDREYADSIDKEVNELLNEYGIRALNCYDDVYERLTR